LGVFVCGAGAGVRGEGDTVAGPSGAKARSHFIDIYGTTEVVTFQSHSFFM
jgi:hypothetical protein